MSALGVLVSMIIHHVHLTWRRLITRLLTPSFHQHSLATLTEELIRLIPIVLSCKSFGGHSKRILGALRKGHELDGGVKKAARELVRERAGYTLFAVTPRDLGWSDDPGDRGAMGGIGGCGDYRAELVLDLRGLHANEATEEEFLFALSFAYVIMGMQKHPEKRNVGRGALPAGLWIGVVVAARMVKRQILDRRNVSQLEPAIRNRNIEYLYVYPSVGFSIKFLYKLSTLLDFPLAY
ncbi:hypothetical protein BDP27DRAFT_1370048 [Rhodocollybia butyracea]|uniref:Uncharacterized protein n=1 Tax=Rhodocollybia butyracea TaxID=206335 RepID=A0A9P5PCT3_9AGAR|nr:hypothetical protein BDP27DRAFT_1370048 [Rhodocollybia butyracea]